MSLFLFGFSHTSDEVQSAVLFSSGKEFFSVETKFLNVLSILASCGKSKCRALLLSEMQSTINHSFSKISTIQTTKLERVLA